MNAIKLIILFIIILTHDILGADETANKKSSKSNLTQKEQIDFKLGKLIYKFNEAQGETHEIDEMIDSLVALNKSNVIDLVSLRSHFVQNFRPWNTNESITKIYQNNIFQSQVFGELLRYIIKSSKGKSVPTDYYELAISLAKAENGYGFVNFKAITIGSPGLKYFTLGFANYIKSVPAHKLLLEQLDLEFDSQSKIDQARSASTLKLINKTIDDDLAGLNEFSALINSIESFKFNFFSYSYLTSIQGIRATLISKNDYGLLSRFDEKMIQSTKNMKNADFKQMILLALTTENPESKKLLD